MMNNYIFTIMEAMENENIEEAKAILKMACFDVSITNKEYCELRNLIY